MNEWEKNPSHQILFSRLYNKWEERDREKKETRRIRRRRIKKNKKKEKRMQIDKMLKQESIIQAVGLWIHPKHYHKVGNQ